MFFKHIKKILLILITLSLGLSALWMFGMEEHAAGQYRPGQQQQPNYGYVPLSQVADWVCGYTFNGENGFRQANGWQQGMLGWNKDYRFYTEQELKGWLVKQYPDCTKSLLALAAEGTLEFNTIADLRQKNTRRINQKGTLDVVIDDSSYPQKTDIRTLMADPNNNGAVFQVASTPSALEGGMHRTDRLVGNMYERAVQGEFASIATMPATLWRKYFLPTSNKEYFLNREFYLWHLCKKITIEPTKDNKKYISYTKLEKNNFDKHDIGFIEVGIHSDVPVVVGYGTGFRDKNAQQPIIVNQNQKITLVLTSAFDFKTVDKFKKKRRNFNQRKNGGIEQCAKTVLDAAYEGTIRAAIAKGKQRVFLTIMGGGSFRNDIDWIYESIEKIKDLIKSSGLHVTLVYRPDVGRKAGLRTNKTDAKFLKKFAGLMNYINNNGSDQFFGLDTVIDNYCYGAYNNSLYPRMIQSLQAGFDQLAGSQLGQPSTQPQYYSQQPQRLVTLPTGGVVPTSQAVQVLQQLNRNSTPTTNTSGTPSNAPQAQPTQPNNQSPVSQSARHTPGQLQRQAAATTPQPKKSSWVIRMFKCLVVKPISWLWRKIF